MSHEPEECEDNDCTGCAWCNSVIYDEPWGYGSGMVGCLYDNGPEGSPTKDDAIECALFIFKEELTEKEYELAKVELEQYHIYYFQGQDQRRRAGVDLVEIWGPEPPPGSRPFTLNAILTIAFDKCQHCGAMMSSPNCDGSYSCPYEQYHDVDQTAPTLRPEALPCGCNLGPGIHESWCRVDAYK
jgi:hypothetical protein